MKAQDIYIYHIVHIENLASILDDNQLLSDAILRDRSGGDGVDGIGYSNIKQRRFAEIAVDCCENKYVGNFVPFYFCPRSPMLYTVNNGNTGYPRGCQSQIIHLVSTMQMGIDLGTQWALSDGNAGAFHANFYNDLGDLDEIDWEAIESNDWKGGTRMHRKMAEFLVCDRFPWSSIEYIGCKSQQIVDRVSQMIQDHTNRLHLPEIGVQPSGMNRNAWYY